MPPKSIRPLGKVIITSEVTTSSSDVLHPKGLPEIEGASLPTSQSETPSKLTSSRERRRSYKPEPRPNGFSATPNDIDMRRLKEEIATKEKEFKSRLDSFLAQIAALTSTNKEKEITEEDLRNQIAELTSQIDKYKALYEEECLQHGSTKRTATELRAELDAKVEELTRLMSQHERQLTVVAAKFESKLSEMQHEHEQALAERDSKIEKLKAQISQTFAGKAWERQHQIDELTKELNQAQEEIERLKLKLRQPGRSTYICADCQKVKKPDVIDKSSEKQRTLIIKRGGQIKQI